MSVARRSIDVIIADWRYQKGLLIGYFEAVLESREDPGRLLSSLAEKIGTLQRIFNEALRKQEEFVEVVDEHPKERRFCCFTSVDSLLFVLGVSSFAVSSLSDLDLPYLKEVGLGLAVCSHAVSKYNDYSSHKIEKKQELALQQLAERAEEIDRLRAEVLSQKFFLDLMESASSSFQHVFRAGVSGEDSYEQEIAIMLCQKVIALDRENEERTTQLTFQAGLDVAHIQDTAREVRSISEIHSWLKGIRDRRREETRLLMEC